jgi:dipeptide/tripeptide permease
MRFNTLTMRQYTLLKNMLQLWYDIIAKTTTLTLPQLQCKCGPQFKSIITTGMPIWDIDEFLKHLGVTKKRSNITRKLTMILIWRCMLLIKIYLFWMLFTIMTSSWTKISKHIFQFFFLPWIQISEHVFQNFCSRTKSKYQEKRKNRHWDLWANICWDVGLQL